MRHPRRDSTLRVQANHRDGSRGQALVELALVLPVMLMLLLIAVDFGRLFTTYVAVSNAAREGASYAAMHASDDPFDSDAFDAAVAAAALREVNAQAQGGEGAMTIDPPACFDASDASSIKCDAASNYAGGIGNQVQVSVRQPFTFMTPMIGEIWGGQLNLDASATAPVLNPISVTVLAPAATPTPTPAATATPAPTPTPTATLPGATPTPTPTATPTPTCTVPDFFNYYFYADPSATSYWANVANFTGTLIDASDGKKIKSQSLEPGTSVVCGTSMTVDDSNNAYPYPGG